MIRLLQWAAIIVIIYFAAVEGIPRVREWVEGVSSNKLTGRPDPFAGEAGTCSHLAHQANAIVVDEIRNAVPPPGDSTQWAAAGDDIARYIRDAQDACECDSPACATGREALSEISELVDDMNLMITGEARFAGGLVQRQERIEVLLEQTRIEAR